jgi:hypothetical protein
VNQFSTGQGCSRQPLHDVAGQDMTEQDQVTRMNRVVAAFGVDITRPDILAGDVWYYARLEGELIARSRDLRMLLDAVEQRLGPVPEAGE